MKNWLIYPFLFVLNAATAQVKISGKVTDQKNHPLQGASISIRNSYDGTTTDSTGKFSFSTSEKNSQVLSVSLSGYSSVERNIVVDKNISDQNITLKELITELKAVIITAGTFEASDQKRTTVLNPIDIVTTASANADITSAIKTLPGPQQVGEEEGLFVRGGTAAETKNYIDGTLVNNFYYSSQPGLAQRGRFNPFLFKGTVFTSGGYSALYGQALSAALILESIDLPERSSAQVSISYLAAGGGFQQLSKNKKSSWGITYNYLDLGLAYSLVPQKSDYFKVPKLHNADANFRIKTRQGMIKYYGSLATVKVGFRYADIDSLGMKDAFSLKNIYTYHNISWKEKLNGGYRINAGISYAYNKDSIRSELLNNENEKQENVGGLFSYKNFTALNKGNYVNARLFLEKRLKGISLARLGGEYNHSNEKGVYYDYLGGAFNERVIQNLVAFYGETDMYITNDLAFRGGLRTEHSEILNQWNLAPRLSLAYKLKNQAQLSFAYGIFYQDPERKYLPSSNKLTFSKASHYILQFQKITSNRTLRAEVYYKKYEDLLKTSSVNGKSSAAGNDGNGYAQGVEVFWRDRKTIKNVDYWLSYSYLDTRRDFLNYPSRIEPSFSARHTASFVVKKFVTKWKTQFNGSYTYATGRPYYDIRTDNITSEYKIYDEGRTKDFNSLSLSVNYLPMIGKANAKQFYVFVLSVTNVLGNNNIYGYTYAYNGSNKQPILPAAKRFFYLGCFLSFGIDRSQDAINNNL